MNIQKKQIQEALNSVKVKGDEKSLIEKGLVTNIVVFGDEVNVDITIHNPTLHAKKQVEVDILKAIHEQVYAKAKICLLYTSPSPRDATLSRMPSSA